MQDTLTKLPGPQTLHKDLCIKKHPKLFLLDLVEFKKINLEYSDNAGDTILRKFAQALQKFAQIHDMTYYRIVDDKFALLKDIPFELQTLEKLINSILQFLKNQIYHYEGHEFNIDAKIGISLDHFESYKKAFSALKLAKEENQPFVTYSQFAIDLSEQNDEEKCQAIKQAVIDKKIFPFFHSIFSNDNTCLFDEILVRIEDSDGIQAPKFFLELAHKEGLYATIVKELSLVVRQFKTPKSLNLSVGDFENEELFDFLIQTYRNSLSIFELQNDKYLQRLQDTSLLEILQENNIGICLDNVKATDELEKYEPGLIDYVKVHGDLIRLLPLKDKEYKITQEILAKTCDLQALAIASHVNSQSSLEAAQEIGFEAFQGFLFTKPCARF